MVPILMWPVPIQWGQYQGPLLWQCVQVNGQRFRCVKCGIRYGWPSNGTHCRLVCEGNADVCSSGDYPNPPPNNDFDKCSECGVCHVPDLCRSNHSKPEVIHEQALRCHCTLPHTHDPGGEPETEQVLVGQTRYRKKERRVLVAGLTDWQRHAGPMVMWCSPLLPPH